MLAVPVSRLWTAKYFFVAVPAEDLVRVQRASHNHKPQELIQPSVAIWPQVKLIHFGPRGKWSDMISERALLMATEKVSTNGLTLGALTAVHDTKSVVMAAVQQNGKALMFASPMLQADRGVVLAAVEQNGKAFYFAHCDMKTDKAFVLEVVKRHGLALKWADASLQADREVVLEAVRSKGRALKYACADLRQDREIVLQAVREDGTALKYASAAMRAVEENILAAVQQSHHAVQHINPDVAPDTLHLVWLHIPEEYGGAREAAIRYGMVRDRMQLEPRM